MPAEKVGDGLDQLTREQHPGLRGVDADVGEDRLELCLHELRRNLVHRRHADRVLGRQRDDGAHPVTAGACKRLQIGLDAGAAPGIGARDREATENGYLDSLRRCEPDQVQRV